MKAVASTNLVMLEYFVYKDVGNQRSTHIYWREINCCQQSRASLAMVENRIQSASAKIAGGSKRYTISLIIFDLRNLSQKYTKIIKNH